MAIQQLKSCIPIQNRTGCRCGCSHMHCKGRTESPSRCHRAAVVAYHGVQAARGIAKHGTIKRGASRGSTIHYANNYATNQHATKILNTRLKNKCMPITTIKLNFNDTESINTACCNVRECIKYLYALRTDTSGMRAADQRE